MIQFCEYVVDIVGFVVLQFRFFYEFEGLADTILRKCYKIPKMLVLRFPSFLFLSFAR